MHIKPKLLILLTAVAAAGTSLAACGSSSGQTESRASATLQPAAATESVDAAATAKRPKLKIASSDYGRILFNGRGRALYLFTADRGKTSNCSGDCATAWPPYIVKAKPAAGPGVKPGLIGTTRRSDGRRQATYAGHPVYFYHGDNEPGEVLCQAVYEFGGYWYVLRANGRAVH
jgi:predicted lipoprotein with Yx(FWY)xxD motif